MISFNAKETRALRAYLTTLEVKTRATKTPIIVGLVGLVGSGKSTVARALARGWPATIIRTDDIRVALHRQKTGFERTDELTAVAVQFVLERGGNVILDADMSRIEKRKKLTAFVRPWKAKIVYVHTHAEPDVIIGRIIRTASGQSSNELFRRAASKWDDQPTKEAVIKLREFWRRTPHHYRWNQQGGGAWKPRRLTFKIISSLDTTDETIWKKELSTLIRKLQAL